MRPAVPLDARQMSDLLREIIEGGRSSAISDPPSPADIRDWMNRDSGRNAWHVAEDEGGEILGLQWIEPHSGLPPEACDIATFVSTARQGIGIGGALFPRTEIAARYCGYAWINAAIRADNAGAMAYYQSRGFEPWGREAGKRLASGRIVDRVFMRFDL